MSFRIKIKISTTIILSIAVPPCIEFMAFVKPIKIITKKTGKIQSVLSQNFKFYTSYPLRVYLKVILLYQIIIFYANLFYPNTFLC